MNGKDYNIMGGISVLILMSIFLVFVVIFLAIIVYEIVSYIFESIAIMCMCKNLKCKAPLTAWIPFYNKYLLGKIAGNEGLGLALALLNIVIACIGIDCYVQSQYDFTTFIIFLICVLAGFLLDIIIADKVYKRSKNKYKDILTVFSVITFGFLRPIFLFIIRNKIEMHDEVNLTTPSNCQRI